MAPRPEDSTASPRSGEKHQPEQTLSADEGADPALSHYRQKIRDIGQSMRDQSISFCGQNYYSAHSAGGKIREGNGRC